VKIGSEGAAMTTYHVKFFKNLLSSDGHLFKVLQRVVTVDRSKTADDASDGATAVRIVRTGFRLDAAR
jgi:hypothetical protein